MKKIKGIKEVKWQRELIDDIENKSILCNVPRATGKTLTICLDILNSMPEKVVVIVDSIEIYKKLIKEKFREISNFSDDNVIMVETLPNDLIKIEWNNMISKIRLRHIDSFSNEIDGEVYEVNSSNVYIHAGRRELSDDVVKGIKQRANKIVQFISDKYVSYKYKMLFSKYILYGIKDARKELNLYLNDEELKALSDVALREIDIKNEIEYSFLERTLKSLEKEYEALNIANNTVMTRKNLLEMILGIKSQMKSVQIDDKTFYHHKLHTEKRGCEVTTILDSEDARNMFDLMSEFFDKDEVLFMTPFGELCLINDEPTFVIKNEEFVKFKIDCSLINKYVKILKEKTKNKIGVMVKY